MLNVYKIRAAFSETAWLLIQGHFGLHFPKDPA